MKNIAKKFLVLIILIALADNLLAQATNTFTGKPTYQILTKRAGNFLGIIKIELFPTIAPLHARNFDSLVSKQFYDSTAFHRVIPGFMIQGGDPNSRHGAIATWGFGDPNQPTVNAEFTAAKHLRGILSAARKANNINSATSQFFICVANYPSLDGQYSVYGRVTAGMNIVDTIVNSPRNMTTNNPLQKIEMFVTRIGSNDTIPNPPQLLSPPTGTIGLDTLPSVQLKWKAVSDAIIYNLEVSTDSLFTSIFKSATLSTLSYNVNNLTGKTKYYWRVKTNNGGRVSAYSPVWNFMTMPIEEIDVTGLATYAANSPVSIYPNPGYGKYTFDNIAIGSVLLVYDLNGKLILEKTVKENQVTVDLQNKGKATFLYKLHLNGKEISSGKLLSN